MIEAVIWDFGGVLTTSPFEAFARFETERGLPADIIRRTNAANHLENAWAKFERAEVDIEAFDELFATESRALGAEVRGKDVVAAAVGRSAARNGRGAQAHQGANSRPAASPTIFPPTRSAAAAAARSMSRKSWCCSITSSSPPRSACAKPDPRIYQMMVETLKVDPEALRLSRRSRRQPETGARHGHDHDQGAQRGAGDRRAGSRDRAGIALDGKSPEFAASRMTQTRLVLCRERGQNTLKSCEFGVETLG